MIQYSTLFVTLVSDLTVFDCFWMSTQLVIP